MAKGRQMQKRKDPSLPAYLQNQQFEHQDDGFGAEDVKMPSIRLLQGTSPQIQDQPDARVGEFWHDGMDVSLGEEVKFIVASRRKRYLLMAPIEDGQGVLARADDGKTWDTIGEWEVQLSRKNTVVWSIKNRDVEKSGLTAWGSSDPEDVNSPPAATLMYEYMVTLPDHPELSPVLIIATRSSIKKARKGLNDKILIHRKNGRPMQAIMFIATPCDDVNKDNQKFKNWAFRGAGFATEEQYNDAVNVANVFATYEAEDDAVAAATTADRGSSGQEDPELDDSVLFSGDDAVTF